VKIFQKLKNAFSGEQLDEPIEKQRQEALTSPLVKQGLWKISEGCDQSPKAEGEFGRTPSNPIPVNGLFGSYAYLNRLRGKTDVGFMFHRVKSQKSKTTGNNVDLYELVSLDGEHWDRLYLDMYYTYRSKKAPSGLYLINWSDTPNNIKSFLKYGIYGTNQKVENFPYGLADIVCKDFGINKLSPGLGMFFANMINSAINKVGKQKWDRPRNWPDSEDTHPVNWCPPQGTTTQNYAIVWQEITSTSNIAKEFNLKIGGDIPYLIYGQNLIDIKSERTVPLDEFMLLTGILTNWSFHNPKIDRQKNDDLWRILLDRLRLGFKFLTTEKMILDVAYKLREDLGAEVSCKVLITGAELIPNSSKIKSDLVLDIFELHRIRKNILDLYMIQKLCNKINFDEIDTNAAQLVAYINLCALHFLNQKEGVSNFLHNVVFKRVSHPQLKNKIKDMLEGNNTIEDMFIK